MIELGVSAGPDGPGVERRNYTAQITAALESWAEAGLYGAALGAVETAAGLYARAFASADVEPAGVRTAGLTPATLASIGRRLVERGESLHLVEVDGGRVTLTESSAWSVTGGPRPSTWKYQATLGGPSVTSTGWYPRDQVAHCTWATSSAEPWRGVSPLTLAGTTGRLAKVLERALADEAGGPVGSLIPMPTDAGGESVDSDDAADPFAPLKRQIAELRGRVGLVESTAAGFGEGRAAAPSSDWAVRRIGANPPATLPALREAVESTVLACCGVPPDLPGRAVGRASHTASGPRRASSRWLAWSLPS